MWIRPRPGAIAAVTAVAFGALATAAGIALAAPSPAPTPGPETTSSSDEIADMVMDAIQRPAAPTTTPVPAPPAG
jgi:hypothetical protein